jgi:hypothetical protein
MFELRRRRCQVRLRVWAKAAKAALNSPATTTIMLAPQQALPTAHTAVQRSAAQGLTWISALEEVDLEFPEGGS